MKRIQSCGVSASSGPGSLLSLTLTPLAISMQLPVMLCEDLRQSFLMT